MTEEEFRFKDTRKMADPAKEPQGIPPHTLPPSDRMKALGFDVGPYTSPEKGIMLMLERLEAQANPDRSHYQIITRDYDDGMARTGTPTTSYPEAERAALETLAKRDIKEVFICTIHAAFGKEVNVKKLL